MAQKVCHCATVCRPVSGRFGKRRDPLRTGGL